MDKDGHILPVGEDWVPDVTDNVTDDVADNKSVTNNVTDNVTDAVTDAVTDMSTAEIRRSVLRTLSVGEGAFRKANLVKDGRECLQKVF